VGDRSYDLSPDDVESVMSAATRAREHGEWLEFHDVNGNLLRLLIPTQLLLVLREYESADTVPTGIPVNDWNSFDFDS
jgi:hypothetical protein